MGGEYATSGFSDAFVILGAAGLVIPAFARIRINPTIGFILIGMLVGPSGLGRLALTHPALHFITISNPQEIEPFAELGIVLLLFSVGLQLSYRRLWRMRALVFGGGAAELLLSAAVIAAIVSLAGGSLAGAIALGIALSLSSTAIVLPLAGTEGSLGRSVIAMLLFEDLALVPIMFVLGAIASPGSGGVAQLALTIGVGAATIAAMLFFGRMLLPPLFAQAARTKNPELFLSAALIVAIVASLVTSAIGLSAVLGALLAGAVIAETDYRAEVELITAPVCGLGLGIFLITVGMSIDFQAIVNQWHSLILALLGVLIVKAMVTAIILKMTGARTSVACEAGVLMASPSETTLIVLAAAAAARLISSHDAVFWEMVTAMGLTVTPLLAKLGKAAGRRFAGRALVAQIDSSSDSAPPGQVIILGFGRVGRMVADMLDVHSRDYLAIDSDVDGVAGARREGYDVIFGDVGRPELVERLAKRQPGAFILTMDNPVLVKRLATALRRSFPAIPIVARARDTSHAAELYRAGATDAVPEAIEASLQLSEATLVDLGVPMGPVIASIHEKRDQLRRALQSDAELDELPIRAKRRLRDRSLS